MKNVIQEVYINLDDSGKLTNKEKVCVYGGLVFLSKLEKDKFITQYRSIINEIKCKYCNTCDNECPEIKNTNIRQSDKRRLINYIKKYYVVGLVVRNDMVYNYIKSSKSAKGRFIDYSIRLMIKEIIKNLIKSKKIDSNQSLRIIINIDQQSTKSNGYYNLKDGLIEELKYGIINFNYNSFFNPIINSDLEIIVTYQNSKLSYAIQAADLLAGTIRYMSLNNEYLTRYVDLNLVLP